MGAKFRGLCRRAIGAGVFCVLLAVPSTSRGADFSGRLIAVVSGDVVEILRDGHRRRIHLGDVVCPARRKPFGEAARQLVAREALDKVVTVLDRGEGRGEVILPGNRSLSQELVRNGLARWDHSVSGDSYLGVLEDDARAARRGLWVNADAEPLSPGKPASKKSRRKR